MTTPAADPKWQPQVREWWDAFWASDLSERLPATSRPALWRLFGWYHRREVFQEKADKRLMVQGSTKQPVVNPLVAQVVSIDRTIEDLEKRLFGPLAVASTPDDAADAFAAIGIRLAAAARDESSDPRLELVEGGRR